VINEGEVETGVEPCRQYRMMMIGCAAEAVKAFIRCGTSPVSCVVSCAAKRNIMTASRIMIAADSHLNKEKIP